MGPSGGLTRRGVLRFGTVIGSAGLAGCSTERVAELDPRRSDGPQSVASGDVPSGDPVGFDWEVFEYTSLERVFERREWDDGGTVHILEAAEFDETLEVDRGEVSDVVEYLEGSDFGAEYVVAFDVTFSRGPYDVAVREVVRRDDEVVIRAVRSGSGEDSDGSTVAGCIRLSRGDDGVPSAARIALEREDPRGDEDDWRQLATYPTDGHSGLSVLMKTEGGEYVDEGYPDELKRGAEYEFVYVVENTEFESQEFTAVTQLQRFDPEGDRELQEREELDRFTTTVEYGGRRAHEREITPTMAGEAIRLQTLLYKGEPPEEPTSENAYHYVHLWVDVVE